MNGAEWYEGPGARPAADYRVGYQQAAWLSNVGGNQHNHYVQQVQAARASFVREVAAARTRARGLIVIGLALFLSGSAIQLSVIATFTGWLDDISTSPAGPDSDIPPGPDGSVFGPDILGVPLAIVGAATIVFGVVLMVVGLVLHVVAASRRRQLDAPRGYHWPAVAPTQNW